MKSDLHGPFTTTTITATTTTWWFCVDQKCPLPGNMSKKAKMYNMIVKKQSGQQYKQEEMAWEEI